MSEKRDESVEDRLIGELEKAQKRIRGLVSDLRALEGRRQGIALLRTGCGCESKVLVPWPPTEYHVRAVMPYRARVILADGPIEDYRIHERRFRLLEAHPDFTCVYVEDVR